MTSLLELPTVPAQADPALSPEALISGPCALPRAPLAMPAQQIEPDLHLAERLARFFARRPVGEGT